MGQNAATLDPSFTEDDIYLTPVEAMKILRIKRSTFYSYVARGIIPAVKIGHFIRIRKENILNLGRLVPPS
jgi:excisionase family DNA binding protein